MSPAFDVAGDLTRPAPNTFSLLEIGESNGVVEDEPPPGFGTEGVSDRFAECLRAIDDEQPRQCRIEPPGEEIVDQLDDDRVLRRPLDHGQDMLVAVAIDADRRHQDMVADMQTVDLDD